MDELTVIDRLQEALREPRLDLEITAAVIVVVALSLVALVLISYMLFTRGRRSNDR